ncbi:MAG TPA: FlgD immunoglobulin-like domain containing protein, partial [Candidatus Krumholzibacteria bacterium]|nr:FlgD immunoglobulin-like domain containing protein [Candidatus Krumholzibacteria bacterium]
TLPADPAAALSAGWSSVYQGSDLEFTELPPSRDFWYYVAFVTDACDNVSAVSNMTAGTMSYHLGDVSDGVTVGTGNNDVALEDISYLGTHYGATRGEALYEAELDVGPTSTMTIDGRPTTDGHIGFEDLILFAINFGVISKQQISWTPPTAAGVNSLVWEAPTNLPAPGEMIDLPLVMDGNGAVLGLSTKLEWDHSVLAFQGFYAGDLLSNQEGSELLLQPGEGVMDLTLLGAREMGIQGKGVLAHASFKVLKQADPDLAAGEVDARDLNNGKVDVTVELSHEQTPAISRPLVTTLRPNYPNPFNPSTSIAFDLAQSGPVSLKIYSVSGRLVRTLVDELRPAGSFVEVWNGIDDTGRGVASGSYLVRLHTLDGSQVQRMILSK